jgi:hypothetical protein
VNGYRQAALTFLHVMATIDGFILAAPDAWIAFVVVAIALRWPSVRGLSINNVASQLGCTPNALPVPLPDSRRWLGSIPPAAFALFGRCRRQAGFDSGVASDGCKLNKPVINVAKTWDRTFSTADFWALDSVSTSPRPGVQNQRNPFVSVTGLSLS